MYAVINTIEKVIFCLSPVELSLPNTINLEIPAEFHVGYLVLNEIDGVFSLSENTAAKIAEDKASRIRAREVLADADIAAQRISTYGFQSEVACVRVHLQWQAMATTPGSWISGELPTEQNVLAYATQKLGLSETFAKYCITRWNQYLAEKAAIEAE